MHFVAMPINAIHPAGTTNPELERGSDHACFQRNAGCHFPSALSSGVPQYFGGDAIERVGPWPDAAYTLENSPDAAAGRLYLDEPDDFISTYLPELSLLRP